MAAAVAACLCREPVTVKNSRCTEKSYPRFWEDYRRLKGRGNMSSSYGKNLRLTIFGQSHSPAIGVPWRGCPAGFAEVREDWAGSCSAAPRDGRSIPPPAREADEPEFLSGLKDGVTCGAPLTAIIRNTDVRSQDYAALRTLPRPGHADYTAQVKFGRGPGRGGRRALLRTG